MNIRPDFFAMSLPLDQLRAQRELVKRHLDWLDAQIAGAPGAAPAVAPVLPKPMVPKFESAPVASSEPSASSDAGAAPAALPAEVLLEIHTPEESGISSGAKYGCVAIAAIIVLGFLFVLFVLPRFLYGDKKDKAPVEDTSSGEHQPAAKPPAGGVR